MVVVSYNSRDRLRACVATAERTRDVRVIVVDNASTDGSLDALGGLDVTAVALERNGGFAHGCNVGWKRGSAPYVLFLNPDARLQPGALDALVDVLAREADVAAAAPRILEEDGETAPSLRRFPRLRSTFAQALFLHRLFPRASWSDELVRDPDDYEHAGSPEWVSGACVLVRRDALERLGGWDERFFMYCEDTDLCRRLRDLGLDVRYEPRSVVVHEGGASAPRSKLIPVLVESRIRYARKHHGAGVALLERVGIGLGALTHMVVARGGIASRRGHARALARVLRPSAPASPPARS